MIDAAEVVALDILEAVRPGIRCGHLFLIRLNRLIGP